MKKIFLIVFLCYTTISVHAQDKPTADELYTIARDKAFDEKDYDAAIFYGQKALRQSPGYTDIKVFIGRVYAWKKDVDSARYYFKSALQDNDEYLDAYSAYADVEYWNDNDSIALNIIEQGLFYNRQYVPLLLRRAKVENSLKEYERSLYTTDTILAIDGKNTEARALANTVKDKIAKNRVGVRYEYVGFDKRFSDPWHFLTVDYTRETDLGSITASVNYANRFARNGLQYELEAYPRFSKTFYGYVNVGYSDDVGVFPRWRAGGSLFANLPASFEAEAGVRYLFFNQDVFIYTGYVGKYYKNFLFGARTYLTPHTNNISQAYSVMARYYYKTVEDFISLSVGTGISPDDRPNIIQLSDNPYKLKTYRADMMFRHAIKRLNIITANATIINQEYLPSTVGNQFQIGVGYIRRF